MGLTRTSSGKIDDASFTSLSGWTNNTNSAFSLDASQPLYVFYPSTKIILAPTPSGADATNCREPHAVYVSASLQYLFYDSSAVKTDPWEIYLAKWTDGWLTPTKLGQITLNHGGSAYASWLSFDMGLVCLDPSLNDGYYYLQNLNSNNSGIPGQPYTNSVYRSTSLEGPYTWVQDSPLNGGVPSFDNKTINMESVFWDGSQWHGFYSAVDDTQTVYNIGHCTAPHLNAAWTKDGTGGLLPAAVIQTSVIENPKVWHDSQSGNYFITLNANNTTQLFGSTSLTNWNNSSTYAAFLQWPNSWQCPTDIWVSGPVYDVNGVPVTDGLGQMGWVMSGDPQDADVSYGNMMHCGIVEPRPGGISVTTSGLDYLTRNVSHSDVVIEFETEKQGTVNTHCLIYRASSGTSDANGYVLTINLGTNTLYRLNGGSFTALGNLTGQPPFVGSLDSRNLWIQRWKIIVSGNHHQIYIDGVLCGDFTDTSGSAIASGNFYGLRAFSGSGCRGRRLSMRTGETVSVSGLPTGASVTLRGAGGIPFDTQSESGGSVTLSSYHYPLSSISVNGTDFPQSGGVWGGDAFTFSAAFNLIPPKLVGQAVNRASTY